MLCAVDILVSRNLLAEEEAEHLSKFNAQILGHGNVRQRIYYVDRLRKEMSDVKQVRLLALLSKRASNFYYDSLDVNHSRMGARCLQGRQCQPAARAGPL